MRVAALIALSCVSIALPVVAQPRGAPPARTFAYLEKASLSAILDTIDTFESPRGGTPQRGNGAYVVRSLRPAEGQRWELTDTWFDSSGHETARQSSLTKPGSLATEREWVRALGDSATLLVGGTHATAWVVPHEKPPKLFDGEVAGPRYAGALVISAIAKSRPPVGRMFLYPTAQLYGSNPLEVRTDSMRVARRDTLYRGSTPLPVLVLERPNGTRFWVDETTGAEIASQGSAGPERWWWHIRRNVRMTPTR